MSNTKECTLTDSELTEKVEKWVTDLCKSGGEKWCLRVPADHNHDPDFIFTEAARRMSRYASRLSELEAENKRLREQHRWIPVTERLPDENIYVLALAKARSIQEPGYNMQVIHSSAIAFGLFSHWQPLPQPPKEQ